MRRLGPCGRRAPLSNFLSAAGVRTLFAMVAASHCPCENSSTSGTISNVAMGLDWMSSLELVDLVVTLLDDALHLDGTAVHQRCGSVTIV